jgi:hypothetical protein
VASMRPAGSRRRFRVGTPGLRLSVRFPVLRPSAAWTSRQGSNRLHLNLMSAVRTPKRGIRDPPLDRV